MGQLAQPLAKEALDFRRAELIADLLGARDVCAPGDSVVERRKGDSFLFQLALEVFMPVDAKLGGVREVGAKLEEERAEILVHAIEVVEIDHGARIDDPGNRA